ncbi:MAG: N-formylglutamate amidohydrolase [Alphaproteobacteria bacterium]|nr:N-formylglutamate amidohydrolase [Alphaproteobacteria bacterium]
MNAQDEQAFVFTPPAAPSSVEAAVRSAMEAPLLLTSPHSGAHYPKSFIDASRLDAHAIRQSEDMFVDALLAHAPQHGIGVLSANYPRAYVDLNRAPYELEQALFKDVLPAHIDRHSARAAAGLGTVPRLVAENTPIYDGKLSFAEAERRIETVYQPFHRKLADTLHALQTGFGYAVLLDTHSMPSQATRLSSEGRRIDFVLGDRHGRSCDARLSDWLERALTARGWQVARNKPYAGGFITDRYGRPADGTHAVQIEINRAIYMDESNYTKHAGFTRLQNDLTELVAAFAAALPALLSDTLPGPTRSAAE